MKATFFILALFWATISFAQFQSLKQLKSDYLANEKNDYEVLFAHFNKTKFLPGEDLWLTVYANSSHTGTPRQLTSNALLSIYNEDNQSVLSNYQIYIENGTGSSFVKLNKAIFKPGKYVAVISTQYLKNFNSNYSYTQELEILSNEKIAVAEPTKTVKPKIFIQDFPEGGHLLKNTANVVALKANYDNGSPVKNYTAVLVNQSKDTLLHFKSNQLGTSKFNFVPQEGQYTIHIKTENGASYKHNLSIVKTIGINLTINTMPQNYTAIQVNTNKTSYDKIKNKPFYLLIHKDGKLFSQEFRFEDGRNNLEIRIPKKALPSGVNTATVFNHQFEPILERLFYNSFGVNRIPLQAKVKEDLLDSLKVEITSSKHIDTLAQMSISVLPIASEAYEPAHSIISANVLKPYVRGHLDQPSYYFNPDISSRKREYLIDLLLCTQGWRKIDWNQLGAKNLKYAAENGFTIKGKLLNHNERRKTTIFLKTPGFSQVFDVNANGEFIAENIYVQDSAKISLGTVNERSEKLKKPKITARILPVKVKNTAFKNYQWKSNDAIDQGSPDFSLKNLNNSIFSTEELDSIVIQAKKARREKPRRFNDVIYTEDINQNHVLVTNFIRSKGYLVKQNIGKLVILSNIRKNISGKGDRQVLLIIDNFQVRDPETADLYLNQLFMEDIEYIAFNQQGSSFGVTGFNGIIKIKTKLDYRERKRSNDLFYEYVSNNGYHPAKEFYRPPFKDFLNPLFKKYGAIEWVDQLILDKNKQKANFLIENTWNRKVNLFIEGISSDGKFISEIIELNTLPTNNE